MPVQRCKRYVFNRVSLNLLTRMFYQLLGGGGGGPFFRRSSNYVRFEF